MLYSPDSHVLFGFVTPATISGSSGDDRLVFYDDNGGDTGRDYTATETTVMNQSIFGIDAIELNIRRANNSHRTRSCSPACLLRESYHHQRRGLPA